MKGMITQALSTKEKSYTVWNGLMVNIKVEENYFSLPPECIFSLAARNNPKRSYLFVSKLIGKHIPVRPRVPFITGFLLASRLAQALNINVDSSVGNDQVKQAAYALANDLEFDMEPVIAKPIYHFPGKALFIGFAETATALGHSVFTSITGNIHYLHTTRETLEGLSETVYFTEDHCHAPDQRCLISEVMLDKANGLIGKTVIHPDHILPVQALYVVTHEEYCDARDILANGGNGGVTKSVYKNKMNESKPHTFWAQRIMELSKIYGVLNERYDYTSIIYEGEKLHCMEWSNGEYQG